MCGKLLSPRYARFVRGALAEMMDVLDKEADGKGVKGPDGETLGGSEEGKGLLESLEGRRVRVTGVFDHTKEVLVGRYLLRSS